MKTKIVCTIGPSTESEERIRDLILNGAGILRLNFSHGNFNIHAKRLETIQKVKRELRKNTKILFDLQGPKIRIADFSGEPIILKEDQEIVFTTNVCKSISQNEILIDDPFLHADLRKRDIILIDDGQIELIVEDVKNHKIKAKVIRGGVLYPRKGVNVPLTATTTSSLTKKDIKDLEFIIKHNPDFIAVSFVQTAQDVSRVRELIVGSKAKVISKIEKAGALKNLSEIIRASDGVLVARGDLGVEMPIEKLPIIQKQIIKMANLAKVPVIAATQMLSSMIDSPFPSRADVTDIANAVFDGADALMLSNETTVGNYPIEALKMMVKIVSATEDYIYNRKNYL